MVATNTEEVPSKFVPEYDRLSELKAFDEKKEGVKGLVDAGVTQIPRIFCHPPKDINKNSAYNDAQFIIPVIDLESISKDSVRRKEIARRVGDASEKLGFFQVVNHGIPVSVLEDMKDGVRRFFEQDTEVKKEFYTRDFTRKMGYNSNYDLYTSTAASWRDSFFSYMAPTRPNPEELPEACRKEMILYSKQVMELGVTLLELLSEALGLDTNHLKKMECGEGLTFVGHYYPACPQPELTLGTTKHTDNDFFTVLLQDHVGGLQVFHEDKWLDVPPVPGALVVNIGDILQLISNDKFKSVEHRVLASHEGPRVSVACFFSTSFQPSSRLYGPIKELLSEDNPPVYRETTVNEYVTYSFKHDIEGTSSLQHFKL